MRRQVGCAVVVAVAVLAAGIFVVLVARHRDNQDRVYCTNNLRELSQFAELAGQYEQTTARRAKAGLPPEGLREIGSLPSVPAGTIDNPSLPPERRLSWVVELLPSFNQKRQDVKGILARIDRNQAWDAPVHDEVSRTRLEALICFANPATVPVGSPAVTQYVGAGGVGPDAATLPLTPFPFAPRSPLLAPPRAGCFRYDTPTPCEAISDGLSKSLLCAELSLDPGPWLQGGPATVRTLDVAPAARAAIGPGGQFGGNHVGGSNFAFADSSVRFLSDRTDPSVLAAWFTISGGTSDAPPGE